MAYIKYARGESETFPVTAQNYPDAFETAMIVRRSIEPPLEVEVAIR
jgi:hypothetical protein